MQMDRQQRMKTETDHIIAELKIAKIWKSGNLEKQSLHHIEGLGVHLGAKVGEDQK